MSLLRSNLGGTGSEPGQLTLPELQVLIRRAGEQCGFHVLREVQVLSGRMDYVWVDPATGRRVVAWELDGRNVCPNHIAGSARRPGNKKKFDACEAWLKAQALYSMRGRLLGSKGFANCQRYLSDDVLIVLDEELMEPGGIESITEEALRLARLHLPPPN
jgi:hypothetical protein